MLAVGGSAETVGVCAERKQLNLQRRDELARRRMEERIKWGEMNCMPSRSETK